MRSRIHWAVWPALCMATSVAAQEASIPIAEARAMFAQAQSLCQADAGRLWGASLCAPIMLVEPKTRRIVASQADANAALRAQDGVFIGELPPEQNVANTAVEWSGTRWTQLLWPLPEDVGVRSTLIAHELFHRLQPSLPIADVKRGENPHLDTLKGRYTLQLEWRALASALQAGDRAEKRAAAADALAFRAERYRRFPEARTGEAALEINEGLAEYTGVVVGNATPKARKAAALRDLEIHVDDASFVRSFAYATGPAYGLLLDELAPGWRQDLDGTPTDLGTRLREAAGIEVATGAAALADAAARYDGATLRATETTREAERLVRLERNRKRFVDGPVLTLDLVHMSVQFNPSNLQPLDSVGTVYPTMRVTDDWGGLEVDGGAVIRSDWKAVIVVAPEKAEGSHLKGPGWTLDLKPGWALSPGKRSGDYTLVGPAR